jgi:DNA-directed RNA polymerase specialized sigma24 family protein
VRSATAGRKVIREQIRRPLQMKFAARTAFVGVCPVPCRANERELTTSAFNKFLTFLNADRELAGWKYVTLYDKLTKFFEWRGCDAPDSYADETINRVARRIDQGVVITNFNGFLFGVARKVLTEALKRMAKERRLLAELARLDHAPEQTCEADELLACIENCLRVMPAESRGLLLAYYQASSSNIEQRRELARQYGISLNALRVRVHRFRVMLEKRVTECTTCSVEGVAGRKTQPEDRRDYRPPARAIRGRRDAAEAARPCTNETARREITRAAGGEPASTSGRARTPDGSPRPDPLYAH